MINGAHYLLYSTNADADRAFLRDVLEFRSVDVGHGWLIFAMPPAEMAVHPGGEGFVQIHADHPMLGCALYLMCDDLTATMKMLADKAVQCTEVAEAPWGIKTTIVLPSGGQVGLYQPKHERAAGMQ